MNYSELRSSGEFSDLTVQVGDRQLDLHRFPLISRSNYFRGLLRSGMSDTKCVRLDFLPGGYEAMELIADFCYGLPVRDRLTTANVGHVMCASSYLQMLGTDNLYGICKAKLKQLTGIVMNCLEILVSCVDVGEVAEVEGVAGLCVAAAVSHWYQGTARFGSSWFPKKGASKWRMELEKLPAKWIALIIDAMQSVNCSLSLTTFFTAGCLDVIMSCYSDLNQPCFQESDSSSCGPDSVCDAIQTSLTVSGPSMASFSPEQQNRPTNSLPTITHPEAPISEAMDRLPSPIEPAIYYSGWCYRSLSSETEKAVLRAYFELFLAYIPNSSLTVIYVPKVTTSWFASIIRFATEVVPQAVDKPLNMCAAVYGRLVLDDVKSFNPELMVDLNNLVRSKHNMHSVAVGKLTDQYLNYRAVSGTVTPSQFAALLSSTSWCPRVSYDSPLQALETLLETDSKSLGVGEVSDSDIMKMVENLDFKKLSQGALERASKNSRIPKEVTLEAAVSVCSKLRDELYQTRQQLQDVNEQKEKMILYPRKQLQGSWTPEGAVSGPELVYCRDHPPKANQFVMTLQPIVCSAQAAQQSNFELRVSTTQHQESRELESGDPFASAMATPARTKCRDFIVRPSYVLPLCSSGDQFWNDWGRGQRKQVQDGIPSYVVYDITSDSLYSPTMRPYGDSRLIKWKRLRHEKK